MIYSEPLVQRIAKQVQRVHGHLHLLQPLAHRDLLAPDPSLARSHAGRLSHGQARNVHWNRFLGST